MASKSKLHNTKSPLTSPFDATFGPQAHLECIFDHLPNCNNPSDRNLPAPTYSERKLHLQNTQENAPHPNSSPRCPQNAIQFIHNKIDTTVNHNSNASLHFTPSAPPSPPTKADIPLTYNEHMESILSAGTPEQTFNCFTSLSWREVIAPWLQRCSTKSLRLNLVLKLHHALKGLAPVVPKSWSDKYGSLARQTRWLRLAYRIPCRDSPREEGMRRVWDSRLSMQEGMRSVARLLGRSCELENVSDFELENVAEGLDEAEVPAPFFRPAFFSEELDYNTVRDMVGELCSLGDEDDWKGVDDFLHKYGYVQYDRRVSEFRLGALRCQVEFWADEVGKEEAIRMCHAVGLVPADQVVSVAVARKMLNEVVRETSEEC